MRFSLCSVIKEVGSDSKMIQELHEQVAQRKLSVQKSGIKTGADTHGQGDIHTWRVGGAVTQWFRVQRSLWCIISVYYVSLSSTWSLAYLSITFPSAIRSQAVLASQFHLHSSLLFTPCSRDIRDSGRA